ncbi:MAG: aminotransferase class I/II-fold pyridoxal phosphate-dependent enzyme [Pseudonocardiaceae bacterium]
MVSQRAARLAAQSPATATAHFRAQADPYHPERNPGGYLNLGTAESRLVWDLLEPRLVAPRPMRAQDTHYAPLHGGAELRKAIAVFLARCWRTAVDPENLVVVSGVTAALDVIASALCDPGDAIIVPAPYYSAFEVNLVGRSGARLIRAPRESAGGFQLDAAVIDRALEGARRDGVTVRAVVLTSPDNPVGHVYPARTLREVWEVARRYDVDLIVDEIYANSVFGPDPFIAALDPAVGAPADRTHVVWGFAKDFGLSGFKVGVLHTGHPEVRAAARALAYFTPVSTDTQFVVRELLADEDWVDGFIAEHRRRLGCSYDQVARLLTEWGIPYVAAGAGFSVWMDLGGWLEMPTFAAEQALWHSIWEATRVNILPGGVFACADPGWFRLCHPTGPAVVREAITRLGRYLSAIDTTSLDLNDDRDR